MQNRIRTQIQNFSRDYFIAYALVGLCIILGFATPKFATMSNMATVLRQASIIAIVACGQYFVMVGGAFDISLGANVGLTGIVFAYSIVNWGVPIWVGALLCLSIGALIGVGNGLLVTKIGIPAFIGTLAFMSICRGLAFVITNATPVTRIPKSIAWIGRGVIGDIRTFGIPIPVVIMFLVFIIAYIVSEKTNFGRKIFAIGGNEEAAYLSGIETNSLRISSFVIAGVLAAFASIILVSRLDSGHPNSGTGFEFDSVTACVIGGVAITGGKGKVLGVLIGAVFLTTFFNGMTLLNVNAFYQDVLKGIVLAFAVGFDAIKNRKKD
jgi:ribose transport system permease protein